MSIGVEVRKKGTIIANGGAVTVLDLMGAPSCGIELSGTWTGTIAFEGQVAEGSWRPVFGTPYAGGTLVTQTTGNGAWILFCPGMTKLRALATAAITGTVAVDIAGSSGVGDPSSFGTSGGGEEVQGVSATGATASEKPVYVGGIDSAGNKQPLTFTDATNKNLAVALRSAAGTATPNISGLGDGEGGVTVLSVNSRSSRFSDGESTFSRERSWTGVQDNAFNGAVGAGGASNSLDVKLYQHVQFFGNVSTAAATNITMQVSQNGSTWRNTPVVVAVGAGGGDFASATLPVGARHVRLTTSAAVTLTATLAAKGI